MAFTRDNWARVSAGNYLSATINLYCFTSSSDSYATITASGYFNDAVEINSNDLIFVKSSDALRILVATKSGTTITTTSFDDGSVADGSITEANLADDAVTMAKAAFPVVVYNSKYTTVAGSATQTITGSFTASDSTVQATLLQEGATPRAIKTAVVNDGNVTIYLDGDPSTDHIINVTVTKG